MLLSCESDHDTVCEACVGDTYSDQESSREPCIPCTTCDEEEVLQMCTSVSDTVCQGKIIRLWRLRMNFNFSPYVSKRLPGNYSRL